MTADERIIVFDELGRIIDKYLSSKISPGRTASDHGSFKKDNNTVLFHDILENAVKEAGIFNPWFDRQNVLIAFSAIFKLLRSTNLNSWLSDYDHKLLSPQTPLNIGVIMAGNIPLAGFHDFLSVLITGNKFTGKLSSRDDRLLPALATVIGLIDKELGRNIHFTDEKLSGIDAIIATGSNNTFRYFDFYFGKYPHIFRKNRNGIAILSGIETPEMLAALGDDIFTYYGLGCRSVSKIFIPYGYDLTRFIDSLERYSSVMEHNKYMNNYQYQRSVYLLNKIEHYDNGFLLLKQDLSYQSPAGVLYYEYYLNMDNVVRRLEQDKDLLQCIVSDNISGLKTIPFGKAQYPELWDYADEINTIDFLIKLVEKSGHDF